MNKFLTLFFIMIPLSVKADITLHGMWDNYPQKELEIVPDINLDFSEWAKEGSSTWSTEVNKTPIIQPIDPGIVYYPNNEVSGTIIIETKRRLLFHVINDVKAYRYPIGVGREGFTWSGVEKVSRIEQWPVWIPPKEMLARRPELPERMNGGLKNPLGAVAIYLGNSLYRIHGTDDPKSIGKAESSGCIRMLNEHAVHLASMTSVGTIVKVFK